MLTVRRSTPSTPLDVDCDDVDAPDVLGARECLRTHESSICHICQSQCAFYHEPRGFQRLAHKMHDAWKQPPL